MTRAPILVLLTVAFVGGCAAYEEAPPAEADQVAVEQDAEPKPEAPVEATPAAEPEPSFEAIERELAANNAKLRELGVPLGAAKPDTAAEEPGEPADAREPSTAPARDEVARPGSAPAGAQAKPKPSAPERKGSRRDKKGTSKAKDADAGPLDDAVARPEPAKAAPLGPSAGDGNLDAAARCEQICDLAGISCSLGEQICELAERHPEEDDYVAACERANSDCEAAKEACDACVE